MNYERGRRDTARPTGFADMAQYVSQRVLRYVSGVCGRRGLRLHARACLCLYAFMAWSAGRRVGVVAGRMWK